ncbi:MAG: peptidoglycan-binding protein [Ruminococcus sp.]|nr:peptidoglycan-binding protein [Ruminococcus sp.]MDE6847743.1 peptidoglycan-binding protein [Ruminococcus sp.]MDE7138285.1 peptidoglycan-binding protein [Ruminococcus sp.]
MAYTNAQKKQHIMELQTYLNAISFVNGHIPSLVPDGIYGKETIFAVRMFQREYGLSETGNTDPVTWNKVVSVYRSYIHTEPVAYNVFPSASYVAHLGEQGQIIYILQAMLNDVGNNYDNAPKVDVCGHYNMETSNAVRFLQRKIGLPQSGNIDSTAWNMLVSCCEHINNTLLRGKKN